MSDRTEYYDTCVLCYRRSRHISVAGLCPECVAELEADDDEETEDEWYRREVAGFGKDEQL